MAPGRSAGSPKRTSPARRCKVTKAKAASNSRTKLSLTKTLSPHKVPQYDGVTVNKDGCAILPVNFLPAPVDQLPSEWFYATYDYFPYFDNTQRDDNDKVRIPPRQKTATPANVAKWRKKAHTIFGNYFHEIAKYHYGNEVGRMTEKDGWKVKGTGGGPVVSTADNVLNMLFEEVAPKLLLDDNIGTIVTYAWK